MHPCLPKRAFLFTKIRILICQKVRIAIYRSHTYPNIVVFLQKKDKTYTHLDTILLESPKNFFIYELPTDNLYNTDKILILEGVRPANRQDAIHLLEKLIQPIKKHFKTPVPSEQLE